MTEKQEKWQTAQIKIFKNMTDNQNQLVPKVISTLIFVIGIFLIVSLFLNLAPFYFAWPWLPQKPFQQFPSLILGTATLIAILTYDRERGKLELENKRTKSEFFYTQASRGLDEVFDLLRDQNNDRTIWVRAARSLLQAIELSEEIELPEYKRAYRLHAHKVRNDLYLALTIKDPDSGHGKSLPASFFYGIPDWKERVDDLDNIAQEAMPPPQAHSIGRHEVPPIPTLKALSFESVCAVFNFVEYPEDYEDPLKQVKVWNPDEYRLWIHPGAGAAIYIKHCKEFRSKRWEK